MDKEIIGEVPKQLLKISYPSGVTVDSGNELTPTQVKDQPQVTWDAEADALYSLTMIDPDAPSRENPTLAEICHWLVINIPGNQLSKGQTLMEYIGSGPPEGSGLHRYIFVVFKQKGKIESDKHVSNTSREGRVNVKTKDYIAKHNLETVAANWYVAQYDDYVPILHAQIKKS